MILLLGPCLDVSKLPSTVLSTLFYPMAAYIG
jgi:hypothetical protein